MKWRVRGWWLGLAVLLIVGLLYVNRVHVLKYSLGWYTDCTTRETPTTRSIGNRGRSKR